MISIKFASLHVVAALSVCAAESERTAVRVFGFSEAGVMLEKFTLRATSVSNHKTVEFSVRGNSQISLEPGLYIFTCSHETLASGAKVVRVAAGHPMDVVIGLPLMNPSIALGDGKTWFEIGGRLSMKTTPVGAARVKIVGISTEEGCDSVVIGGRYSCRIRSAGSYRVFVLSGSAILYETPLTLTYEMLPKQTIDIDLP